MTTKAAERGIAASAQHAERVLPHWGDMALQNLVMFALGEGSPFTIEEFRAWAQQVGLPDPPDGRAFGSVTRRAVREGIIRPTGRYAPTTASNGSVKMLYTAT